MRSISMLYFLFLAIVVGYFFGNLNPFHVVSTAFITSLVYALLEDLKIIK